MANILEEVKKHLESWCDSNKETFYRVSEKVWSTPELSMQEHLSSQAVIELLEDHGFNVEKGVAGMPTAFVASYGEGRPIIGINTEYDALPGLSQQKEALNKNPIIEGAPGHGCGHNLMAVAGPKAAIAVKEVIEKYSLPGTIRIIGTPAEELCLGKPFMGKAGILSGYDAFLDWHPWNYNKSNYDSCCAYFSVKYHFKGRTSHGNSPWHGRSALDAAMLQAHAVEMMREHIYPGEPPDAANTINYTFSDTGPEFPSVVPDKASAWYIGRFTTSETAKNALDRITKCAEGAALSTETTVDRELITFTNHKIPNKTLAEIMNANFHRVGPPDFSQEEHEKAMQIQKEMGVEETGLAREILPFEGGYTVVCDTSEFSWNAPYATAWIAMAMEGCGWHNWGVTKCASDTMGKKSLDTAAKVISLTAAELILRPDLVKAARDEFEERLGGKKYQCLLAEDMVPPIKLNKDVSEKYK